MKNKYSIMQIREVWINAYLHGEVDWLDYIEIPLFFVIRNGRSISKSEEIEFIERSRRKFPNRRADNVEYAEVVDQMQERKYWGTVSGSAKIKKNGAIASQFYFFELWLVVDNRWQIAKLCIEDIDHKQES